MRPCFELPSSQNERGGFVAQMPRQVVDLRVSKGEAVKADQVFIVLEEMNMGHAMKASFDGVIGEVREHVGDQVESGTVLLMSVSEEERTSTED
jgi:acetyl/propionyl-CoA carboxylase alpha subunit